MTRKRTKPVTNVTIFTQIRKTLKSYFVVFTRDAVSAVQEGLGGKFLGIFWQLN